MLIVVMLVALGSDVPPTTQDMLFNRAVEQFCMSTGVKPPAAIIKRLDQLGADRWKDRQAASQQFFDAGAAESRWLYWGLERREPEVRLRANQVLRRLSVCHQCQGGGLCRFVPQQHDPDASRACGQSSWQHGPTDWRPGLPCGPCGGEGRFWTRTIWD